MIHITALLENAQIIARVHDAETTTVTFGDGMTGRQVDRQLTPKELGAILLLALAGDDLGDQELTDKLYAIAEPACAGLDSGMRPIP